jgi:hypothetical protein
MKRGGVAQGGSGQPGTAKPYRTAGGIAAGHERVGRVDMERGGVAARGVRSAR